jgi:hypothetical protein
MYGIKLRRYSPNEIDIQGLIRDIERIDKL